MSCLSSWPPSLAAPNPPRRVLVPLTPARPCVTKGKFTLLSYNLLADLYATVGGSARGQGVGRGLPRVVGPERSATAGGTEGLQATAII